MTTPISSHNPTDHITNRLESLSVTDEPQHIVQSTPPSFAAACQEFEEAMRAECEASSRAISSALANMRHDFVAAYEAEARVSREFFVSLDNSHAEFMERLKILRERLDRIS